MNSMGAMAIMLTGKQPSHMMGMHQTTETSQQNGGERATQLPRQITEELDPLRAIQAE